MISRLKTVRSAHSGPVLGVLIAVWLVATTSHADGGMWGGGHSAPPSSPPRPPEPWGCVCIGPYFGGRIGDPLSLTLGGEASFFWHPDRMRYEGIGAFFQAEHTFGTSPSERLALGVELGGALGGALGIELGAGVRLGKLGPTPQLHIAPYLSIGFAFVSLRLAPGYGGYGTEGGAFLGLKAPFLFGEGAR
jgi:hypothetical protein